MTEIPVRVTHYGALPSLEEKERAERSWLPRIWFYAAVIRVPKSRPRALVAVPVMWRRHVHVFELLIGLKDIDSSSSGG